MWETISSKPPKTWCCEYKLLELKPLLWVGIVLVHSVPLFSSCSHRWNCVQKVCSAFFFFQHGPTIVYLFSFVLLMLWVLFSWKYSSLGVHCCCLLLEFCGLGHWKMQVVNVGPLWGTSCRVESGLLLPSELQVWLQSERGKEEPDWDFLF